MDNALVIQSSSGERKIATDLVVDPTFGPVHLFRVVVENTADFPGGGSSSGGLTDTELRASPVDVDVANIPHVVVDSMPASGGGLTNTELRASPVPVSGTFWQATQPVSIAATVPVSGPLTDTQLRANPVPVSGTFFQATQPVSIAATVNVAGPLTDTQLRASAVPVSGPLTDTQLRATPVPVSGTVGITGNVEVVNDVGNPLPVSGTFWQATQPVSVSSTPALTDTQLRANPVKVQPSYAGRAHVAIYAEAIAGATAETLISLIKSTGFGAAAAGATSIAPTAGKTMRLLMMVLTWVATTTTANTCRVRIRVNPSAGATLSSPIQFSARIAWESATFIANEAEMQIIPLGEGIDVPSGGGLAASIQCVAANGTLDISFIGYEYTP